jgi:ComF family protein
MLSNLLDYIFPKRSINGKFGMWLTNDEINHLVISPVIENTERLRERSLSYLDCISAAMPYGNKSIKKVIWFWKYKRIFAYGNVLSKIIAEIDFPVGNEAVLCPVPLHWSRKYWRGFNQAYVLASSISNAKDIPILNLLKRTRPTGHQAHRKRKERLLAMKGAFKYIGGFPAPLHVILIDDLATTGATLDECAKVLKEAGVKRVEGWVVAHG